MKIAGLCSGHDCSYGILENGIPVIHNELERFNRKKEPIDNALRFLFDTYDDYNNIKNFVSCLNTSRLANIQKRYPDHFNKMIDIVNDNNGKFYQPGHHECHAANAFFSSNFNESLIITMDGGGEDYDYNNNNNHMITAFTAWYGLDTEIKLIEILDHKKINIGNGWNKIVTDVFGLSGTGGEFGNQAGTVMAMACMSNSEDFYDYFKSNNFDLKYLNALIESSHVEKYQEGCVSFDIARGWQRYTEKLIRDNINHYIYEYEKLVGKKPENLCLSGGVSLNSVAVGKMYDWFPQIKNIFVDPVPYDAGLALGGPRLVWHQYLGNPRIRWEDNSSPYLGKTYSKDEIKKALIKHDNKIKTSITSDEEVVDLLLINDNVVSVFGGGSESGRRALGNRSILADPRSPNMKDIINQKVKHRQWFRPFAPSILREDVKEWFERDVSSPYMTSVIKFKKSARNKVPAVVHYDGSARLQTVTENDNKWYYRFIKKFKEKTGVPILLNTSFNDREPIVETPEHAINCFLGTDIDYLYFYDEKILVRKNK